jgi:hypothetical protein
MMEDREPIAIGRFVRGTASVASPALEAGTAGSELRTGEFRFVRIVADRNDLRTRVERNEPRLERALCDPADLLIPGTRVVADDFRTSPGKSLNHGGVGVVSGHHRNLAFIDLDAEWT